MKNTQKSLKRPLAQLLVERNVFASIDDAQRWIMGGNVLVNEQRIDKPGTLVLCSAEIRVKGQHQYVSRGAYKLEAALDYFHVIVAGKAALDCGASTGGFTDCLLQRGASLVYAVDVGYGQLAGRLRIDRRVRNLERTNLGTPTLGTLEPHPNLITLDLSYLSLTDALPLAATLLVSGGEILALFKPLFEVKSTIARRTGSIENPVLIVDALHNVLEAGRQTGLHPLGVVKLALRPKHGVQEFFIHLGIGDDAPTWNYDDTTLTSIVDSSGIGRLD